MSRRINRKLARRETDEDEEDEEDEASGESSLKSKVTGANTFYNADFVSIFYYYYLN